MGLSSSERTLRNTENSPKLHPESFLTRLPGLPGTPRESPGSRVPGSDEAVPQQTAALRGAEGLSGAGRSAVSRGDGPTRDYLGGRGEEGAL